MRDSVPWLGAAAEHPGVSLTTCTNDELEDMVSQGADWSTVGETRSTRPALELQCDSPGFLQGADAARALASEGGR